MFTDRRKAGVPALLAALLLGTAALSGCATETRDTRPVVEDGFDGGYGERRSSGSRGAGGPAYDEGDIGVGFDEQYYDDSAGSGFDEGSVDSIYDDDFGPGPDLSPDAGAFGEATDPEIMPRANEPL